MSRKRNCCAQTAAALDVPVPPLLTTPSPATLDHASADQSHHRDRCRLGHGLTSCPSASHDPATVHCGLLYAEGFPDTVALFVSFCRLRGPQNDGQL